MGAAKWRTARIYHTATTQRRIRPAHPRHEPGADEGLTKIPWCPGRESNPYSQRPRDFKSLVSTNFTTRAAGRSCRRPGNKKGKAPLRFPFFFYWSGRRVSNSRPQPWQGCALPTELLPQISGGASRSRTDLHGFAIRCITALLSRPVLSCDTTRKKAMLPSKILERQKSLELSTSTLARLRSTN